MSAVSIGPSHWVGNGDAWWTDVKRGTWTRITTDPAVDMWPLWSPDGSQLVFRSARRGSFTVYLKTMTGNGSEERPLVTDGPLNGAPTDWSSHGHVLLMTIADPATATEPEPRVVGSAVAGVRHVHDAAVNRDADRLQSA